MRYGLAAAALWSALGIACEEPNTAIVVTVSADEVLGVDQIVLSASLRDEPGITVFSRSSPDAPGPVVTRRVFTIIDDGDLVGRTLDFQVVGMSASSAQAITQTSATFRRDEVVRITVDLSGELNGACGDGECNIAECERCPNDCDASICQQCHDECEIGDAMTPACNLCVREVCDQLPSCCEEEWNMECADAASELCGADCTGQFGCGNATCDPGETDETCPQDCPIGCGDQNCDINRGEDCNSCPTDCGPCGETCGNEVCDPDECESCPQDCADESCPCHHDVCTEDSALPYGCDDSPCVRRVCDDMPSCCIDDWGPQCADAARAQCSPDEAAAECLCGDGFCGDAESCDTCEQDCACVCGNGTCDPGEGCDSCPGDCVPEGFDDPIGVPCGGECYACMADGPWFCGPCSECGDGFCDLEETCFGCPEDCGLCDECGNDTCDIGETCWNCPQDCGASCGPGECSACASPFSSPTCEPCGYCGDESCDLARGETCGTCDRDCGSCGCPHTACQLGGPLDAGCDVCTSAVCELDPVCCALGWDARCVEEAEALCGGCP